jgi:hypothetical protein
LVAVTLNYDAQAKEASKGQHPFSGSDDICSVLGKLPGHPASKCQPCSQTGSFDRPFPFRKYPPPTTLHP